MMQNSIWSWEDFLEPMQAFCREDFSVMEANLIGEFFGNPVAYRFSSHLLQFDVEGLRHGFVDVDDTTLTILYQRDCWNIVHERPVAFVRILFLFLGKLQRPQHAVDPLAEIENFVIPLTMHPR